MGLKEDLKTEIVCILNNKIKWEEDDSIGLDVYWRVAEDILKLLKGGLTE